MTTTTNYPDHSFTYRGIKATLTYIGEGYLGDYDPSDPDDAPLYRLDIERGRSHLVSGSACTNIVAGLDSDYRSIIRKIAEYAHARHYEGMSLEGAAAGASWFSNDSLTDHQGVTA